VNSISLLFLFSAESGAKIRDAGTRPVFLGRKSTKIPTIQKKSKKYPKKIQTNRSETSNFAPATRNCGPRRYADQART